MKRRNIESKLKTNNLKKLTMLTGFDHPHNIKYGGDDLLRTTLGDSKIITDFAKKTKHNRLLRKGVKQKYSNSFVMNSTGFSSSSNSTNLSRKERDMKMRMTRILMGDEISRREKKRRGLSMSFRRNKTPRELVFDHRKFSLSMRRKILKSPADDILSKFAGNNFNYRPKN